MNENEKAICDKLRNAYIATGIKNGRDVMDFFDKEHEAIGHYKTAYEHYDSDDRVRGCDEVNLLYRACTINVEICFSPDENERSLTVHLIEGKKKTLLFDSNTF